MIVPTLEGKINHFCLRYRPRSEDAAYQFIEELRELMNEYAQLALENGEVPDAARHVCRGVRREGGNT
jgi:thiamine monophosphate synthase